VTDVAAQIDAFTTPGSLLKAAREKLRMTEREAADRLNFMPDYVAILERDDYQALRSPPFARGYVKAYGRLLGLDEAHLMAVFDQVVEVPPIQYERRAAASPLQLQRTGLGVVVGLLVLLMLVVALWWWGGGVPEQPLSELDNDISLHSVFAQQQAGGSQ
jgi:cytoskeleton protein RodZ